MLNVATPIGIAIRWVIEKVDLRESMNLQQSSRSTNLNS